jgi:streptogramin lyase
MDRYVIGKITTTGVITEYTIGTRPLSALTGIPSGTEAYAISAGPDGNLWFTGNHVSSFMPTVGVIGKVTPAGVVTEYTAGITGPSGDIAPGPRGDLWFTVADGKVGKIGRITTAGAVTQYSAAISGGVGEITPGPDRNLWFTAGRNRVGKITPAGAITEYGAGIISATGAITVGSDGNLWFTEPYSARIARITTRGVVTAYSYGSGFATGITRGADGNLWLPLRTGGSTGYIARFNPTSTSSKRGHVWTQTQCKSTYEAWTKTHHHAARSQRKVEANKLHKLHGCPLSILK